MSNLLKLLVYFFIIVGVLKYYETKLNDDKQIIMVVLLILFLIMISDFLFFKNTEGFAKTKVKKSKDQKLKDRKKKIKKLKNDCPNPIGNTITEPTKYPDVQPAVFNQCTPNPLWNNRTGMTYDLRGEGCPNPQDACVPYRVADPTDNTKFFETAACVPIQTAPKVVNSCANPTEFSGAPNFIEQPTCGCTETSCGSGQTCYTSLIQSTNQYGPRDINGMLIGKEKKECLSNQESYTRFIATKPPSGWDL